MSPEIDVNIHQVALGANARKSTRWREFGSLSQMPPNAGKTANFHTYQPEMCAHTMEHDQLILITLLGCYLLTHPAGNGDIDDDNERLKLPGQSIYSYRGCHCQKRRVRRRQRRRRPKVIHHIQSSRRKSIGCVAPARVFQCAAMCVRHTQPADVHPRTNKCTGD